ncbi:hypothetical protein Bca101_002923 [Brassica carinata]
MVTLDCGSIHPIQTTLERCYNKNLPLSSHCTSKISHKKLQSVMSLDPREVVVPVVGGHARVTILPLLSQAKAGAGSATLSMAYAAVKFADACLKGIRGDANIVECAFVASHVTELPFFASKVRLGRCGVDEVYGLGPLNEYGGWDWRRQRKSLKGVLRKVLPL